MPLTSPPSAPVAPQKPQPDTHHNITRTDEYAWLRDPNWQQVMRQPETLKPEIAAHLQAENDFTEAVMQQSGDLRDTLFDEMRGRLREDESTPPAPQGAWAWLTKYEPGGEHPQICRSLRNGDQREIILNGNALSAGLDYFKLGGVEAAPDQNRLAWAADIKGSEYFTLKIRDIESGADLPDCLENTSGGMAWSACGEFLFYVQVDDNHRPNRVMRHRLGTKQTEDALVYEEHDAGFFVSLSASRSGELIFISAHDHETSETHMIDAHRPQDPPRPVTLRQSGLEYEVHHDAARDRLIILTNKLAVDFSLMWATLATPDDWHELVPPQGGQLVLDVAAYADHLVWLSRENALPQLTVLDIATGQTKNIRFDEQAYELTLDPGLEYDTHICRFAYASMTTPRQIFDYDMRADSRQLVHQQIIPSGHAPENYVTRRLWATAKDGAKIPVSLFYRTDTPLDGTAPVLLYGYGAYGITIPAGFSPSRLSLVNRGFIFAIAHIRGGKAMGHDWLLQGRGKNKPNSFTDFIAAAEMLVDANLTKAGQITIHGGSAGGLLVGATVNLAPELFCGAVAEVPFVDVLTTMLDDSLPLTPPEWPEWGNPISSAADYQTIAGYAPYENIRATAYPHILATAGLTDPRVTYWEPAKWVARLRDRRTDDGLTLLQTEMSAGHGGKAGRYNQLRELASVYAFILLIHGHSDAAKHEAKA